MRFFFLTFLILPNNCYSRERYNEGFRFKAKLMTPVSLNDTLRQVYDTNHDFQIKQVFLCIYSFIHIDTYTTILTFTLPNIFLTQILYIYTPRFRRIRYMQTFIFILRKTSNYIHRNTLAQTSR